MDAVIGFVSRIRGTIPGPNSQLNSSTTSTLWFVDTPICSSTYRSTARQ